MKKEDLLLVFDFLATALRPEEVQPMKYEDAPKKSWHEPVEVIPEIKVEEDKGAEPPVELSKELNAIFEKEQKSLKHENDFLTKFKNESSYVKKLMAKVNESENRIGSLHSSSIGEDKTNKLLRQQQNAFDTMLGRIQNEVRDLVVTPEQKALFRNFVAVEDMKARQELDGIDRLIRQGKWKAPVDDEDAKPDETDNERLIKKVGIMLDTPPKQEISEDVLRDSKVPQIIKDLMRSKGPAKVETDSVTIIKEPTVDDEVPSELIIKLKDGKPQVTRREFDGGNGQMFFE